MKTKIRCYVLPFILFIFLLLICISSTVQAEWSFGITGITQVTGFGSEAQGAGIALINLSYSDPRPEMILMAYDNTSGVKTFRYKVGWNVGTNGVPTSWSPVYQVPGVGSDAQGAGMAYANLDSNARPEMVLMAYDNTSGVKTFRYKIGWNVGTNGVPTSWSPVYQVAGFGSEAQGAGIAFTNLDSNPAPEMVLMACDKPASGANTFRYKVGWNVGTNGVPTSWSPVYQVAGFGPEAQGAGIAFTNVDSNPAPEMVLMDCNKPASWAENTFRYKIGWNVGANGVASSWSPVNQYPGVGSNAQGAGIAFANLDSSGWPEMVLMAYDNTSRVKTFRYYRIGGDLWSIPLAAIYWNSILQHIQAVLKAIEASITK